MPTISPEQLATGSYNLSGSFSGSFSGTVTGAPPPFPFSGPAQIIGNVTASGNVSASNIYTSQLFLPSLGKVTILLRDVLAHDASTLKVGSDSGWDSIEYGRGDTSQHNFKGVITSNITASSNISASGTIVASNLIGTNTGDQDLSSFITSAQTASISVLSASFATTASHLLNNPPPFPFTGDAQITGSLNMTGDIITPASITNQGTTRTLFTTASIVYSGSNVTQVTQSFGSTQQITNITYSGSFEDGNPLNIAVTGSDGVNKLYTLTYSASLVTQIIQS